MISQNVPILFLFCLACGCLIMTSGNLKAAHFWRVFQRCNLTRPCCAEPCPVQLFDSQTSDVMQLGCVPSGYVPHLVAKGQRNE